ncbi:MAG: tetratricopeptide repeat protein [bacterium]|nr:MAG: tetratricopeptide repeat protein [bacterium]
MKLRRIIRRSVFLALVATVTAYLYSCAYFNTLYNARKIFKEAEQIREQGGSERELKDKYKEVVKKTAKMVSEYPNSRWVDDGLFLMGKALVRQGETSKGIRKFTELITNFPDSKYVPRSLYWLAYTHFERREYNQALAFIDRFLKNYPDHDFRYRVLFLAGDINSKLEQSEEALNFYAQVAEEASSRKVVEEAVLKSAEFFYENEQWEKAAANYGRLLRKGLPAEKRQEFSLRLGKCYTNFGRCEDALRIFNELIEEVTSSKEQPPLMLGKASSYVCMDSLETALAVYRETIDRFPKSGYSAEAYYHMGIIYHEQMDSLVRAQDAFSKVGREYASSEYAAVALQKSNSLKRLLELQASPGEVESDEQHAEKVFMEAELQLTRLNDVQMALKRYAAVIDSFPGTSFAPRAAYALAWIYHRELEDRDKAIEWYRTVATNYPRAPQARGAVDQIGNLGMEELKEHFAAYVDSAIADTTGAAEALRREMQARADSARVDTLVRPGAGPTVPGQPDTTMTPPAGTRGVQPADTLVTPPAGTRGVQPVDSARVDTLVRPGAGPTVPGQPDTTMTPPAGTRGVQPADTLVTPPAGTRGVQPADTLVTPPAGTRGVQPVDTLVTPPARRPPAPDTLTTGQGKE